MRIGELSRQSGFSIDTIRYYDKIRLIHPSRRNPISRFREYGEDSLDLLVLVRSAKVAGLALPQIRRILAAAKNGAACKTVLPLLDQKVREVDRSIRTLQELRARLTQALKTGFPRKKAAGCSCPILMKLKSATESAGKV